MTLRVARLGASEVALGKRLFALMADVFEEPYSVLSDAYVARLLGRDTFWALAAFSGEELVGGLTAHALPMTRTESTELFVFDIAVHPQHQRKGAGRQLVSQLRLEGAAQGIHDVFVAADAEDAHALDFYRALGGEAAEATVFTFARRDSVT